MLYNPAQTPDKRKKDKGIVLLMELLSGSYLKKSLVKKVILKNLSRTYIMILLLKMQEIVEPSSNELVFAFLLFSPHQECF